MGLNGQPPNGHSEPEPTAILRLVAVFALIERIER